MANIGVKGLYMKDVNEINQFIDMFIKSSNHIKTGLINSKIKKKNGDDSNDTIMLSLLRDTYVCNLLMRYIGMMTMISNDQGWIMLDSKMNEYSEKYYCDEKYRNRLIELYEYYIKIYEKSKMNYDYCKFLDKIITRCNVSKKALETKNTIRMTENNMYGIININPTIEIDLKYLSKNILASLKQNNGTIFNDNHEIANDKLVIDLSEDNYSKLIQYIDDINVRHYIEDEYMSRSKNVMEHLAQLVILRKEFAHEMKYETYFKYIYRGKHDNSNTIKYLIDELIKNINKKSNDEMKKINDHYVAKHKIQTKLTACDINKYSLSLKNNKKVYPTTAISVIFEVLKTYFCINIIKTDTPTWQKNVIMYNMVDINTDKTFAKLYIDLEYNDAKKISKPLSIRLTDCMQISDVSQEKAKIIGNEFLTLPEIALLGNYRNNEMIEYDDVTLLFKEFGYILNSACYQSRVGSVNHDEEFSNLVPYIMQWFALDKNIMGKIMKNYDPTIIDHILLNNKHTLCFNMLNKCISARFDHIIHNDEKFISSLASCTPTNRGKLLQNKYKEIHDELMKSKINHYEANVKYIDPIVIVQEISGNQGYIYGSLMNDFFAYTIYWGLKENIVKNQKMHFRNTVLHDGVTSYRELVRAFIETLNIDCFTFYLKNVLNINMHEKNDDDMNKFEKIKSVDEDVAGIVINRA
jgi:hypothetical protein